ncbi:MAG: hypothetical protein U9N77_03435 [Thermodesulfobacteriota bacterium]|nr:hypothetical protein [Thermodesulfobacteriota bacterium]
MTKKIRKIIFIIILALLYVLPVFAHKVIVFAWMENGLVHTESSFGGDDRVHNGKITAFDAKGNLIFKGVTDDNGELSFTVPDNFHSDLIIKLDACTGHQAQWRIPKEKFKNSSSAEDINRAMEKKAELESGPSFFQIIAGIGIIFLIAFAGRFINKKYRNKNR